VLTGWATPCVPYGGAPDIGIQFLPEVGAGVWVEFEEGDPEFPIWVGTFWSSPNRSSEIPPVTDADGAAAPDDRGRPEPKIIRTAAGHTLQLDDTAGAEKVTIVDGAHGHVISLDDRGVTVLDGRNGHRITLAAAGVEIVDGRHEGNRVALDASGVTVADASGHTVALSSSGVVVGNPGTQVSVGADGVALGTGATEPLVLGTSFATLVAAFSVAVATHVHAAPGDPPKSPAGGAIVPLTVPLSAKCRTA
jgi:uncharacterized protein involved in type VI secretion and phage assembly